MRLLMLILLTLVIGLFMDPLITYYPKKEVSHSPATKPANPDIDTPIVWDKIDDPRVWDKRRFRVEQVKIIIDPTVDYTYCNEIHSVYIITDKKTRKEYVVGISGVGPSGVVGLSLVGISNPAKHNMEE